MYMRLSNIAFTFITLLVTSSVAMASNDPITVSLLSKKHSSKSAALEVTACRPTSILPCLNDPKVSSMLIQERQFGVRVHSETASPTLDDAIASIRRMPNISMRSTTQTSNVVIVWDRRL
jgi:hypothetical protein